MMIRLTTINNALAARGVKEKLFKGKGYFYFSDGDASSWPVTSVNVYRLNQLQFAQWLQQWLLLSGSAKFPSDK